MVTEGRASGFYRLLRWLFTKDPAKTGLSNIAKGRVAGTAVGADLALNQGRITGSVVDTGVGVASDMAVKGAGILADGLTTAARNAWEAGLKDPMTGAVIGGFTLLGAWMLMKNLDSDSAEKDIEINIQRPLDQQDRKAIRQPMPVSGPVPGLPPS
tara:strand:- start:17704 stop:18171 length:468 start_codon:yes stop_codon:yes gene_type:complete